MTETKRTITGLRIGVRYHGPCAVCGESTDDSDSKSALLGKDAETGKFAVAHARCAGWSVTYRGRAAAEGTGPSSIEVG